jgi:nitrogenase molybdenum-iron protein alpha/beta subunit
MEEPKQKIPNSINWVGEWGFPLEPPQMSDMQEMGRVLNKIGITVHCSLVGGEEISRLVRAPEAEVNTMRCTGNALNAMRRMEEKFEMPYVATGIPQGIQPTIDFIIATAEKLDMVKKAEEVIEEEVKQTLEAIEPYKRILEGKRVAISAATARVMAVAKFAVEMRMESVFLGFHYIREKTFANVRDFLKTTGLNPEAIVELSVYEEESIMRRLKPDLWLIDPTEQSAGLSQGVPTFMHMAYMSPSWAFGRRLIWRGCLLVL